jgi:hypothetical protein
MMNCISCILDAMSSTGIMCRKAIDADRQMKETKIAGTTPTIVGFIHSLNDRWPV